jgi:hypothetical protein
MEKLIQCGDIDSSESVRTVDVFGYAQAGSAVHPKKGFARPQPLAGTWLIENTGCRIKSGMT